ncbi:DoxX family protein [Kineosporia succinea]|uniref:Oxidoreductase n=1 Tax=Kineosporia succinea TaxID=84632 RepID=A0ABT9NXC5_9ACTN|nr:DoxX family protein [Kineosporia succinea]MDP9825084.1 putative oxidoreductase [Kineosporia succinea]
MNNALLRDLVVLVARIAVGVVFIAHGWQKFSTNGMEATASGFDMMGVPAPTVSAWFAAIVELAGGALLIAGLALPVAGVLLFVDMLGAFAIVHAGSGVFVDQGGYELVLTLGVVALLLAAVGAGRFSLDQVVSPRLAKGAVA